MPADRKLVPVPLCTGRRGSHSPIANAEFAIFAWRALSSGSHKTSATDGSFCIKLAGTLDEESATQIAEAAWAELGRSDASLHVLFDLRAVDNCKILARATLVSLQQQIATTSRRTAWLSTRPRFRGLATLICHSSDDPCAKVVANMPQALEWFASSEQRLDVAARVAERLNDIKAGGQSR